MNNTFKKESDFHDNWAITTELEQIKVNELFEGPLALENKFIMRELGNIENKEILDVGAGLCESSIYFAKKGAKVTALDLSPKMLDLGRKLAIHHNVQINTTNIPAELIEGEERFDIIYVANTIHHLNDKEKFLSASKRLLKPKGTFISWDPIKYNPAINFYRRRAMGVRTEDECPLGIEDLKLIKEYFPHSTTKFFWISGLLIFIKYYFINKVDPNKERYWKKIYTETDKKLWWWKPLGFIDVTLTRLPLVRWLAWNMVITARK
jgi:2-polyprenyl-3-methyl-5-hydroxy-6-metoxy-1,4-benzoquinol methylase